MSDSFNARQRRRARFPPFPLIERQPQPVVPAGVKMTGAPHLLQLECDRSNDAVQDGQREGLVTGATQSRRRSASSAYLVSVRARGMVSLFAPFVLIARKKRGGPTGPAHRHCQTVTASDRRLRSETCCRSVCRSTSSKASSSPDPRRSRHSRRSEERRV